MESKYFNFLLDENEINRIAKEVGLCRRIRTFTPIELLKMVVFYPNNIAKDILDEILYLSTQKYTIFQLKSIPLWVKKLLLLQPLFSFFESIRISIHIYYVGLMG